MRRMSYSISVADTPKSEVRSALLVAAAESVGYLSDDCRGAAGDHYAKAIEFVDAALATVGSPEAHVSVSVSGHAHEGHGNHPSWADECITVSISAIEPATPLDPDAG